MIRRKLRAAARLIRRTDGVSRSAFSFDALLHELSARVPVMLCVSRDECEVGIVDEHLGIVLAHLVAFADRHGARVSLEPGGGTIHRRLSPRQAWSVAGAPRVAIRLHSTNATLLRFGLHTYDKSGHVLRNPKDVLMQTLPRPISDELLAGRTGLLTAAQLLGGAYREPEPIDIVYTWVDGRDSAWRRSYIEHVGAEPDPDRYHPRGELRYSLRSVHYACGWARRIHILSSCPPPAWLDVDHPAIAWVSHEEVLEEHCLPTFNSHAIEAGLPNIPDLAERFIYLNDDVFVTRPTRPELFFDAAGRSYGFFEPAGKLVEDRRDAEEEPWFVARLAAQRLLLERFGYAATRFCHHAPFAVNRARCLEMFASMRDAVARTSASRTREATDMPLIAFLYPHHALAAGWGLEREVHAQQLSRASFETFRLRDEAHFLCINDGGGSRGDVAFGQRVERLMRERFPIPAPWERADR